MQHKRVTLFAGHYGSGKTNIAVNYAIALKEQGERVAIADLDIVNPYFRTKDSRAALERAGVSLISSAYANSNSDMPSLPSETYSVFHNRDTCAVLDVGGDDRGALALGRYRPYLLEENDFEMLFVVNFHRPLTRVPEQAFEVLREIEIASKLSFSGLVNNSNIGRDTTSETVLKSQALALELSGICGLPIKMTCAEKKLCGELEGRVSDLFPLSLQERLYELDGKYNI